MESFPLSSVTEGSVEDLTSTLNSFNKSIRKRSDAQGNTALHLSVINDKILFLEPLLKHEKKFSNDKEVTDWVNELNLDGFSVLHLTVSKGNLNLVKLLFKHGADNDIRTPMGLDAVHLAAQNDFPQLIAYFAETKLELESKDSKGLTPLHWASYMGSYHSALVLCSCRVSRNTKDNEGHTPLHLAVVGNNLRVTKLLIIKGSLKDAKDNQGKTPMDHAVINRFTSLVDSLKSNTFLEVMGFKPNITPFATSLWPFFILLGGLVACFVLIGVFCATYNRNVTYIFAITSGLVVTFMVFLVKSDPGFLPKDPNNKLTDLYEAHKPSEICPDCKIIKIARSRHCHQCHRCVMKFDHHCQWMNNCIGGRNLGVFYIFIIFLFSNIGIGIGMCCIVFAATKTDNDGDKIPINASQAIAGVCLLIELFMLAPVSYLLYTHSVNFITGLTTNERMTAGGKTLEVNNPCCTNCYHMCCNVKNEDLYHERFTSHALLDISLQQRD